MANNGPAPGAYYTGPPAAPHDKDKAPPSPSEPKQAPGYYDPAPKAGAGGGQGSPAVAAKESGFFASCCACFSGGQTAK